MKTLGIEYRGLKNVASPEMPGRCKSEITELASAPELVPFIPRHVLQSVRGVPQARQVSDGPRGQPELVQAGAGHRGCIAMLFSSRAVPPVTKIKRAA